MRAKLPVLGLVVAAWRDVLGHLPGLARIAWPYYALALALSLLAMAGRAGGPTSGGGLIGAIAPALGEGTAEIVLSLCVVACAVRWQRHVVLAEPLRGIAPLDGRVLRYALWNMLVGLVAALPLGAAALLGYATGAIARTPQAEAPFAIGFAGIGLLGLGVAAASFFLMRLCLVPVGVSIDDRAMGLQRSWAATRGNGLRLLGIMLLLVLGFGALATAAAGLQLLVTVAGPENATGAILIATSIIEALLDLLTGMAGASALAFVYRALAANGAAVRRPEA